MSKEIFADQDGIFKNNRLDVLEKRKAGHISQVIALITTCTGGIIMPDAIPMVVTIPYCHLVDVEAIAAPFFAIAQSLPECHTWRGVIAVVQPDNTRRVIAEYPGGKGKGYNQQAEQLSKISLN
jgi:hypothetical protein